MRKLALLILALALAVVGCKRHPHLSPIPPPDRQLVGAGTYGNAVFYANMRAAGRFYVTDPVFGGVCDGSHDDTAAINAALLAAQGSYVGSVGGPIGGKVVIPQVPGACMVSSPIRVMYPAFVEGDGNTPEQCIIRSSVAMEETLYFRPAFGLTNGFRGNLSVDRAIMQNFTVDANHLAKDAIRLIGGEWSLISNVNAVNGVQTGYRETCTQLPLVLSAVTPGGGGIAGVTVSQPDNNYQGVGQDTTASVVLKVVDPGALDTATMTISINGGSTFETGKQPLSASTNLAFADLGGVQFMYGIMAHFPVHNYLANETYSFTAATQSADYNLSESGVAEMTFRDLSMNYDGPMYASAGVVSTYNGYNVTTTAGSCTTVAGSQLITCPLANFATFQGFGFLRGAISINGAVYQVPSILSNSVLAVTPGTEPTTNFTGDYAIALGGGYYADGHLDGPDQIYSGGNANFCSICYQFTGLTGHLFSGTTPSACGLSAFSLGDGNESPFAHSTFLNMHIASQAGVSGAAFLISPNSSGIIVEPSGAFSVAGSTGGWILESGGSIGPLATTGSTVVGTAQSWLTQYSSVFRQTLQDVASSSATITGPSQASSQAGSSTYVLLSASGGNVTLTSRPTIACPNPLRPGLRMILQMAGPWVVTFLNQSTQLSGIALNSEQLAMGKDDILELISTGTNNPCWREISRSVGTYGGNWAGNTGIGTGRTTTVSSTTPKAIYTMSTNGGGVSNGIAMSFDVSAMSLLGANIAWWHDCKLLFDKTGVVNATIACASIYGVTGGVTSNTTPPLGWAISTDASGTVPSHIYGAGDVSANMVIWNVQVFYHGPGQGGDVLPLLSFDVFSDPYLPKRWRARRADNDNALECDDTMAA
jgi:hypothetical protein